MARPATGGYALLLGERQPMYPNPTRERGAIPQVPHLRFGLGLVAFILPLALLDCFVI